ncbi:MAG: FAD-linked oxidase C-terminal domain-containing protein [Bdellovibrionota bacterium]
MDKVNDASVVEERIRTALSELSGLEGRVSVAQAYRESHSRDESHHHPVLPHAVVFARSAADVSKTLQVCNRLQIPVVAFGTGTGLEGGAIPMLGGISLDLSEMNQIVAVHEADFDVRVQPGVTHRSLNKALRASGLFFAVDPGADASLGGMAATRASGTNAVRYGTMRENVLALEVVLADGRIIRTGRRTKKSAAGYDLTRLFIGSEGTLGIITELTLRLHGIPEATAAAICGFQSLDGAVSTVIATMQSGIPIARIELLDEVMVDAVNRYAQLSLPVRNTLFLEFHGSPSSVAEQAAVVEELANDNGGSQFEWKTDPDERAQLWRARHEAAWACKALRPGSEFFFTDVCVPISHLARCILETKADFRESSLLAPLVGHVGDGNFHLFIMLDPKNPSELREARLLNTRLVERALALEGTSTGEHGIGIGKREFLEPEHGAAVELMRQLKQCLDPNDILNPGKVFLDP